MLLSQTDKEDFKSYKYLQENFISFAVWEQ